MRYRIALLAAVAGLVFLPRLRADEVALVNSSPPSEAVDGSAASSTKVSYEFDGDTSYVGATRTSFGLSPAGDVSEERTGGKLVLGLQSNDAPIYRFGLAYQRYSFGFSRATPLPDALQSENVVVGMDFELFNSWLVRVEADPGFYGDGRDFGFRDFNVPFSIGGSYITGADLQLVLGIEVDVNRQIPVLPAVGLRWAFMDNWVLDGILPTPRIEYDWSRDLTLYAGADFDDGTYRVAPGVGAALGRRNLGGGIVEYDEIRVGAGLSWKAAKGVTLELEGGYMPYREFDFHRADVHFINDDGAPYGQMSLNAQF